MTNDRLQDRRSHHSWGEHKTLLQSVDCAQDVQLLNPTEERVLRLLCRNIEFGLDAPYSVLPVEEAAFELCCSDETIRRNVVSLERKRFLSRDMPANGCRGRFRNKVNGLNLSLLLERHEELIQRRANKKEDMKTFRALKAEIGSVRGRISTALRDGCELSMEAALCWSKLPRRITTKCVETLSGLLELCRSVLAGVSEHPTDLGDATHTDTGQFTDTHNNPISSKYVAEKEDEQKNGNQTKKTKTFLTALSVLDQAITSDTDLAAHADGFMHYRDPTLGAIELCSEMALAVGVPHRSVLAARDRVDTGDFLGLCLLVWAKCSQRGRVPAYDQIMKPANWFGSMGAKSQRGEAHVLQSLLGLQKHFAHSA